MITKRNAAMNTIGPLCTCHGRRRPLPCDAADVHAQGGTYTWTCDRPAAGRIVCMRKVDSALVFSLIQRRARSVAAPRPAVLDLAGQTPRRRYAARSRPGRA